MTLPYYKRFPRDFLDGTVGMTLEQKGAYGIVIDLIFSRDGKLPDDARYIAGQLGCSVRKWNSIKNFLVEEGKLTICNDVISNKRADYLLKETRKYRDKQAENRRKYNKNSQEEKPSLPSRERVQKTELPDGGARETEIAMVRRLCLEAAGLDENALAGKPNLVAPTDIIHLMRPASGVPCDLELDILPAIQRGAAQLADNGQSLNSWRYFREAAIRNRDQRLAPAPAVQQRPANAGSGGSDNPALAALVSLQRASRREDHDRGIPEEDAVIIEHEELARARFG